MGTETNLPPEFNSVLLELANAPEHVREMWLYAIAIVMIDDKKAHVIATRQHSGRMYLDMQKVSGERFSVVRPEMSEEKETLFLAQLRGIIKPSETETLDIEILEELQENGSAWTTDNFGDVFERSIARFAELQTPSGRYIANQLMWKLIEVASRADLGWRLFTSPPTIPRSLTDTETLNLFSILHTLHELCYGFTMLDSSASRGWGGSAATRFYLNGVYQYISFLFLLDAQSQVPLGVPMGGTVARILHPLGLMSLLEPIREILDRPFGKQRTVGQAILTWRNKYITHLDLTRDKIEGLIEDTAIRDHAKQLEWREHLTDLFYAILQLRLQLMALATRENLNPRNSIIRDLQSRGVDIVGIDE